MAIQGVLMEHAPVVLVIDGSRSYEDGFVVGLGIEGFHVVLAGTGEEGLELASRTRPNVIIVSTLLPDLSSQAMLRRLHGMDVAPVIALSNSDDENEGVLALEMGAVDVLSRPSRVRESAARIWSAMRVPTDPSIRPILSPHDPSSGESNLVVAGPVEVDMWRREVRVRGETIHAAPKEIDLLDPVREIGALH